MRFVLYTWIKFNIYKNEKNITSGLENDKCNAYEKRELKKGHNMKVVLFEWSILLIYQW